MISKFEPNKALSLLCIGVLILSILGMLATIPISSGGVAGTITVSSTTITDDSGQVLMITITDADIVGGEENPPRVTVDKTMFIHGDPTVTLTQVPMYQISGGSWVGYIAIDDALIPAGVPAASAPQDPTAPSGGYAITYAQIAAGMEPDMAVFTANDIIAVLDVAAGQTITITYHDASPAAARTVSIDVVAGTKATVTLDRDSYPPTAVGAATVKVVVSDVDLNLDPTAADTLAAGLMSVTGLTTPPTIAADLVETGPNTGEFKGTFSLGAPAEAVRGEVMTVHYTDTVDYTAAATEDRKAYASIVATTGSLTLDASEYTISDTATVTLTDPDRNLYSGEKDEVDVTVTSTRDTTGFTMTLKETGTNTGIFTKTFGFQFGSTDAAARKIWVEAGGDKVTAKYTDPMTSTGSTGVTIEARATFKTFTGSISLDKDRYSPGQTGIITVVDPDLNLNPAAIDRISRTGDIQSDTDWGTVGVLSSVDGVYYQVLLLETDVNTGEFTGTFKISATTSSAGDTPTIHVSEASPTFKARYLDDRDDVGEDKKLEVSATVKANTGSISMDQSSYSPGADAGIRSATGEMVKITIVDPDLNVNPLGFDALPTGTAFIRGDRGANIGGAIAETDISDQFAETGPNTGEFLCKYWLPADVQINDVIIVTYHDSLDENMKERDITASAIILASTGVISVDKAEVPIKGKIKVTVSDPDWNLNPDVAETIPGGNPVKTWGGVDYWTTTTGELGGTQIKLAETGKDTGIFEATITVGVDYLDTTQVKRGDTLYFRYNDDLDAGGASVRTTVTATVTATTGSISLDKTEYPDKATVIATIVDPDMNIDPNVVDTIPADRVWITTTSHTEPVEKEATETGTDTGEFEVKFVLDTDIPAKLGDGITVTYKDMATADGRVDVIFTATATVKQYTGKVYFDKDTYLMNETATITVEDPDLNTRSKVIESYKVSVWSTTDPAGISITVIETGAATGVFVGTLSFTEGSSVGSKLQVTKGDTITVKYRDTTADPADIPGWTPGVDTILTIKDTAKIGVPYIEKPIAAGTPVLKDPTTGETITEGKAGEQVMLSTEMSNTATEDQPMLYIVQVKDETGRVVYLSFISGTVPAGETYEFGIGWTPTVAGTYTVEVFAWVSWAEPTPLSDVATATITIVE